VQKTFFAKKKKSAKKLFVMTVKNYNATVPSECITSLAVRRKLTTRPTFLF